MFHEGKGLRSLLDKLNPVKRLEEVATVLKKAIEPKKPKPSKKKGKK